MIKRVISIALALMLVVACFAGITVSADDGYTAKLGYANSDWSAQEWGDNVNTTVTGAGDYSVSWDGAASDALVFVIDIVGAGADFQAAGLELTALSVTVDGTELPVDLSKVVTGDIEENGNWRIEIYNEYGSTKENAPIDPATVTFASNLTVNFSLGVAEAASNEFAAKLGYANSDWSAQEWGDNANTTVTGDGTYSVSWDGAGSDALVFVVDLVGAQAALGETKTFELTALTVTVDGTDLPVDLSKVVTGDIEENGNWRIEIYNEYGTTKEAAPVDPATVTFASNLTVTFTVATVDVEVEPTDPVETEPTLEFDPAGTYNAYLLLQTPNWTYRDAWNDANGIGSDYWGQYIYGNETSETYGVVTDAVIAGNGTYTVSITDFGTIFADDFAAAGQDYFNIIGLSTDIPLSEDVVITDVKLIVDGSTKHTQATAYLDPDVTDYCKILIQNKWNEDVAEISYYPTPSTSLEIQFTISGFNYDAESAEPNETDPVGTTAPAATDPVDNGSEGGNMTGIIIAVVVIAVVAVVVVVVLKKKKAN